MAFTPEQKKAWRQDPKVKARNRDYENRWKVAKGLRKFISLRPEKWFVDGKLRYKVPEAWIKKGVDKSTDVCTDCKQVKPLEDFPGRHNRHHRCRECCSIWRKENADKIKVRAKRYRESNKHRKNYERYRESGRLSTIRKARQKERLKSDTKFSTWRRIQKGVKNFLGGSKSERTQSYVGCTAEQLRAHLISTLPKSKRNITNFDGYHIDHIVPLSAFTIEQAKIAWNWQNLRLLPAKENLLKRDKLTHPQMFLPLELT